MLNTEISTIAIDINPLLLKKVFGRIQDFNINVLRRDYKYSEMLLINGY